VTIAFTRAYRLVPRGAAGLACDDDGVALGPVTLVEAASDPSGQRFYRLRPEAEVAQALRLAYGWAPDYIERCRRGLARVAQLLTAGEQAQACIHAVQLAFPEIAPEGMAKLAHAASVQKYNPNWAAEPRIPDGPGGGDWTTDSSGGGDANIQPAAAPMNPVQAMKERFVDAHLADTQKAAERLGIPVENILGVSALESTWGTSRFASQGNNYFGIHYPAPYTTGYMQAKRGPAKVATFASYADSLKSFVATSGSLIQGKSDPEAFATALQNSGKFGINPDTGAKVPTYVPKVAATILGLRAIVARGKI
jgi:Mannosyl-glycoprotein endo-beta-N-acetylglucosaminidase